MGLLNSIRTWLKKEPREWGCGECGYDNGFKYQEETSDGVSPGMMQWYYCLGCNGGGRRRKWRTEADRLHYEKHQILKDE